MSEAEEGEEEQTSSNTWRTKSSWFAKLLLLLEIEGEGKGLLLLSDSEVGKGREERERSNSVGEEQEEVPELSTRVPLDGEEERGEGEERSDGTRTIGKAAKEEGEDPFITTESEGDEVEGSIDD